MPNKTYDSSSYKNLISSCKNKNLNINYLYSGDNLNIEPNLNIKILSPSYIQDDNNPNSIVFDLEFKNKSFLFTGDTESSNEIDMINSFDLEDVDFLKVSHHGSSSSTNIDFLKEASPDLAVISCGYKNNYGHPHQSTLDNLYNNGISVYRTDLLGDIVFFSDGNTIFTKKNYKYN